MVNFGQTLRGAVKDFGAWVGRKQVSPEDKPALPPPPLAQAAKEFLELAEAADRYADTHGFYKRALNAKVPFTRLTKTPVIRDLWAAVHRADAARLANPSTPLPDELLLAILTQSERLHKVLSHPTKSVVFRAPFDLAARQNIPYQGPALHETSQRLFETVAFYRQARGIEEIIRDMARTRTPHGHTRPPTTQL